MSKKVYKLESAPSAAGPYSQAIAANGFLLLAGMVGFVRNKETGLWQMPEGLVLFGKSDESESAEQALSLGDETRLVLNNIKLALGDAALREDYGEITLNDVVRNVVYVRGFEENSDRLKEVNEAYAPYFDDEPPVRTTVGGFPPGFNIEIECTVALPMASQ